jgi:opacity protein-like surface antigen
MKKISLSLMTTLLLITAQAQLDFSNVRIDVGGNYTMYKGDFQQKTPGVKVRVSVPSGDRIAIGLGFTYGFPIKTPSEIALSGGGSVPSEIAYNFKTIHLDGNYFFGGEKEDGLTVYGSAGIGLVLVGYKENIKGNIPAGEQPMDQIEPGNESGFTLNFGLGTQYSLGTAKIFGDAGLALPANQVNEQAVENVIPAHFTFNLGVRFSLGTRSDD